MTYQIIDKLLFLAIFVVIASVLWSFFGFDIKKESVETAPSKVPDPAQEAEKKEASPAIQVDWPEYEASPLIVRHLTDKATLLIRSRARKQSCTGHLLVWSGAKRKRIQDSLYDLGMIEGDKPTEPVIEEFLRLAKVQIGELAKAGQRKRKAVKSEQEVVVAAAVEEEVVSVPVVAAANEAIQQPVAPMVSVEDAPPEAIKMRKFPSLYRGIITEIGMMKQSKDGREFETFGVRYRTPEGIEDAVFGANLRIALRKAEARVGDSVEILKVGRKTIEPGKAPMNLFTVAKLQAEAM